MRTNLTCVTAVHNVVQAKYPWKYSILSALPICDQFIVIDSGPNDDATTEELCSLAATRPHGAIRIIASPDEFERAIAYNKHLNTENEVEGYSFFDISCDDRCTWPNNADKLSGVINIAIDAAQTEWVMELQSDEVLAEWDYNVLINTINGFLPTVNSAIVWFKHFCGDLRHEFPFNYTYTPRICRKSSGLRLFGDAFAIFIPRESIELVAPVKILLYHCGKVHTGREYGAAVKEYRFQKDLYEGKLFAHTDPMVVSAYEKGRMDYFEVFGVQKDIEIKPYDGPWPAMVKAWAKNDLGVEL